MHKTVTLEILIVESMKLVTWDVLRSGITSHKTIHFNAEVRIKYLLL